MSIIERRKFEKKRTELLQKLAEAYNEPHNTAPLTVAKARLVALYDRNHELLAEPELSEGQPSIMDSSTWLSLRGLFIALAVLTASAATVASAGFANLRWSFLVGIFGPVQLLITVLCSLQGWHGALTVTGVIFTAVTGLFAQMQSRGDGIPSRSELGFKASGYVYLACTLVTGILVYLATRGVHPRVRARQAAESLAANPELVKEALRHV